jgi:hypothetical protein
VEPKVIQSFVHLAVLLALVPGGTEAQAPPPTAARPVAALHRALGEVTAVDAAGREIRLKTDAGEAVTVRTDEKTSFLRAQPGARDLSGATPVSLGDIALGDRVLARGTLGADRSVSARQVVVMARADIAQKHEQEEADWRRRGVSGVITALDAARQGITVEARSLSGAQTVTVSASERGPGFKRYAPGSVRYADARPSSFAELRVGDQVRVLGDRTPDGAKVVAEQVVAGSFRTLSGAVKSVDGRTVTIVDNETGRPLAVTVGPDALVRRLPPEMAARLAVRGRPGGEGARAGGPGAGPRRPGGPPAAGPPDGARPRGGPPPEGAPRMGAQTLQDVLERLPPLPVEQLQRGDQVAVSSAEPAGSSAVTAVVLVAGIEPLLEARPRGAGPGGETLGLAAGALDMGLGIE